MLSTNPAFKEGLEARPPRERRSPPERCALLNLAPTTLFTQQSVLRERCGQVYEVPEARRV